MNILSLIIKTIISLSFFVNQTPFIIDDANYLDNIETYNKADQSITLGVEADKIAIFLDDKDILLFAKDENEVQAMASITKLMTALVFFDEDLDLDSTYIITDEDALEGGKRHFFVGEEVKLKDVLYTALIASDNEAAAILAKASGDEDKFIEDMNLKAKKMALVNTHFDDPTGLTKNNKSTAREIALIFKEAWKNPQIREVLTKSEYSFETLQGREKSIISTDSYLLTQSQDYPYLLGGKTGYIEEAGYCFVGGFAVSEDEMITVVVLNSKDKNSRFTDSEKMIKWVTDNYQQF